MRIKLIAGNGDGEPMPGRRRVGLDVAKGRALPPIKLKWDTEPGTTFLENLGQILLILAHSHFCRRTFCHWATITATLILVAMCPAAYSEGAGSDPRHIRPVSEASSQPKSSQAATQFTQTPIASQNRNSLSSGNADQETADKSVDRILSYTANILTTAGNTVSTANNTVGIAAVITTVLGIAFTLLLGMVAFFGWDLHKEQNRIRTTQEAIVKARDEYLKDVAQIKNVRRAVYRGFIMGANFSLTQLPEITYTQQIPLQLLQDLGLLEKALFEKNSDVDDFALELPEEEDGTRILYALGLYYLGKRGQNKDEMTAPTPVRVPNSAGLERGNETVITLFERALKGAQDNRALHTSVRLRLALAFRQQDDFDQAENTLSEGIENRELDAETATLKWGHVVLTLQRGMAERDLNKRREFFRKAKERSLALFNEVFGEGLDGRPFASMLQQRNGSIAYYAAKAMWAWRFSFPLRPRPIDTNEHQKQFTKDFRRATKEALIRIATARQHNIADPYTSAIYDLCAAYIVAAINGASELDFPPLGTFGYLITGDNTDPKRDDFLRYAKECLRSASNTIKRLRQNARANGDVNYAIYVESLERLGSLAEFAKDIEIVGDALENGQVLYEFFQKETSNDSTFLA